MSRRNNEVKALAIDYSEEELEATPEEATPEEVAPEEVAPEEATPEEVAPEEVAPEEVAPEEKKAKNKAANTNTKPKEKKVKIKLPLTKENTKPLFISVNNRNYMIQRGKEVEVPEFVADQVRHNERMMEEQIAFVSDLEEEFEEKSKQL